MISPSIIIQHPEEVLMHLEAILRQCIRLCERVIVSYSGGVDSSLVAKVASEELGDKALIVLGCSPSLSAINFKKACALAKENHFHLKTLPLQDMKVPDYVKNDSLRCYHCRKILYKKLHSIAKKEGIHWILNGEHMDDLAQRREGLKAADRYHVRSVLRECGFNKKHVRRLAQKLSLSNYHQAEDACLSSRIPEGTTITQGRLEQVEDAEACLQQLGLSACRVRLLGTAAKIEVPLAHMNEVIRYQHSILIHFKSLGFTAVFLDLVPLERP